MNIKCVNKPWGHELWIADGTNSYYALKKIFFKAGNRTSLQVHKFKYETNYVLSGLGKLLISENEFDIDNFLANGMSDEAVQEYENHMKVIVLEPGVSFNVAPGYVHRVIAIEDLEFMEASTCHLDDVYRLQDDANRTHGKIESEHS